jgi:hypothetical protein
MSKITLDTLIPLSMVASLIGGASWLGTTGHKADRAEQAVIKIQEDVTRIKEDVAEIKGLINKDRIRR